MEFSKSFQTKASLYSFEFFDVLSEAYIPSKKYKRKQAEWKASASPSERHDACLLEYGENPKALSSSFMSGSTNQTGSGRNSQSDFEKHLAQVEKKTSADAAKQKEALVKKTEEWLGYMQETDSSLSSGKVSSKKIGNLINMQNSEVQQSVESYKESEKQLKEAVDRGDVLANAKIGRYMGAQRKIRNLKSSINVVNLKLEGLEETQKAKSTDFQDVDSQHQELRQRNTKIVKDIEAIEQRAGQDPNFGKLSSLFAAEDHLRREHQAFLDNCERILENFRSEISRREAIRVEDTDSQSARSLASAQEKYANVLKKHSRLRRRCALRNREADQLRRKLDDVPSRQELLQYRRRFVELYEQLGAQLDELRRHNTVYNMLSEKRHLLEKEDSLLESISSQFSDSVKSQNSRKAFVSRCKTLLSGLEESLAEQRETCDSKRHGKDQAASMRTDLLNEQRKYLKVLKDFQKECDKFDRLQQN